jgi:adenylate kinase
MSDLFLLIMGVQGSGKGTQATAITKKYGISHISTGDLFRAMFKRDDDFARHIKAVLDSGQLVDDETTCAVLKERMEQPDAAYGALLDGFPRNETQADFLKDYLASRGQRLNAALLLDLDLYTAFKRAFGRVTSADGRAFNLYSHSEGVNWTIEPDATKTFPPRLTATLIETGETLKRRDDDANAMAAVDRIDKYLAETAPLIPYYEAQGILRKINADQSIQTVTEQLIAAVEDAR